MVVVRVLVFGFVECFCFVWVKCVLLCRRSIVGGRGWISVVLRVVCLGVVVGGWSSVFLFCLLLFFLRWCFPFFWVDGFVVVFVFFFCFFCVFFWLVVLLALFCGCVLVCYVICLVSFWFGWCVCDCLFCVFWCFRFCEVFLRMF